MVLQKKYMRASRSLPRAFAHLQGREVRECCPETTEHAAESSELVPAPLLCPGQSHFPSGGCNMFGASLPPYSELAGPLFSV